MFTPKTNYAKIAYDTVLFFVSTGQVRKMNEDKISADLKLKMACFVSIFDSNDTLLSCYGTIDPQTEFLYEEIIQNAAKAAKNDSYESIKNEQLGQIKVVVDVLSALHKVENKAELKPQKHGLVIKTSAGNTGFIMPRKKGIKTVEDQIKFITEENGIKEEDYSKLELWYFKSTRYD
jgi:AMMECR1 domain-containing protein